MLAITYTVEEKRLLECADLAEAAHRAGLYDQRTTGDPECGTPGCLIGHYRIKHRRGADYAMDSFWGCAPGEWDELFGTAGCDNTGRDGLQAAAYVRAFVERKVRARLSGE